MAFSVATFPRLCGNIDLMRSAHLPVHHWSHAEWNLEDAIAVAREDGLEEGRTKGLEEGREEGIEKGRANEKLEIARNLLTEGATLDFIQKITGLDIETIKNL